MTEPLPADPLPRWWWLRPWRTARQQHAHAALNAMLLAESLRAHSETLEHNERLRAEAALATGASPVARSIGWEQPAGAVTPAFAVLAYQRGAAPGGGYRVYASRELAGSVIEQAGEDEQARFRAHLIMGRMIVLNVARPDEVLATLDRLWPDRDAAR